MSAMSFLLFLCEAAMILIGLAVFMHKDDQNAQEGVTEDPEIVSKPGRSESGTATTVVATMDGVDVSTDEYSIDAANNTPQNTDEYTASTNDNKDDYDASANDNTDDYNVSTNDNTDDYTTKYGKML